MGNQLKLTKTVFAEILLPETCWCHHTTAWSWPILVYRGGSKTRATTRHPRANCRSNGCHRSQSTFGGSPRPATSGCSECACGRYWWWEWNRSRGSRTMTWLAKSRTASGWRCRLSVPQDCIVSCRSVGHLNPARGPRSEMSRKCSSTWTDIQKTNTAIIWITR